MRSSVSILDKLSAALADRYTIEREIGAGGMATVYLAQDIRHRRKVAIKVLHPELTAVLGPERFLNEIELTANLQHPHILPLFDSGSADNLLFYVMPLVEGETLRTRLSREQQLPIAEALRIASDVADALEYAHKHGIVHRDIKPENILLHDGRPLVADFGIALAVQQAGGERMTQTGMSLGTPQYMAPEQAMGDKAVDHRADIYALGAITYEMLTGEPPFTGPNAQAVVAKILTTDPSSLVSKRRSVPPHVEAAVLTALEKMPADRFASAAQFVEALAGRGPTLQTRSTAAAGFPPKRDLRQRALAASPWVLAVLGLAFGAWGAINPPKQDVTRQRVLVWRSSTPITVVGRLFALSPDGQTMAYVDTVGGQKIWLKERDQLDPTAIAGTADAGALVFSPDGQWLAFVSDGKLRKVPRLGGSSVILSDSAALNPSIAWLEDGTILFTSPNADLLAVGDEGGAVRRALTADSTNRGVMNVTGVRGGRRALIGTCRPGCEDAELRSLDVETGRTRLLATDALQGWHLDDHVVFVRRDGGVFSARFDARALTLESQPVPVFSGVRTGLTIPDMTISASGTLAYIAGGAQAGTSVQPVWVTRAGVISPIDTSWSFVAGANWGMSLSPDGTRLAVGARGSSSDDIWVKELPRGALRRLTFEGQNTRAAAWSADGRSVIYTSVRSGSTDLRMRHADGTGAEETLIDIARNVYEVALTPDPAQFIIRVGQPPSRDILLYKAGGQLVPLVTAERYHESWPMLSRDGRWLAYGSDETGKFEVYVRPFPDVEGGKWQISRSGGFEPYWAHNGRELFYRDAAGNMVSVAVQSGATFSHGDQSVLFATRGLRILSQGRSFDVTRDGARFIMTRLEGQSANEAPQPLVLVENWGRELRNSGSRGQ